MTIGAKMNLLIEIALLFAVENNEIEAVLKRLKGGRHRRVRVNFLTRGTTARIHAAARQAGINLAFSENADKLALLLALLEGLDLAEDNPGDQRAQSQRLRAAILGRRPRQLPIGRQGTPLAGRAKGNCEGGHGFR